MNSPVTISKNPDPELGNGFAVLRETGLKYIQQLASDLWTDYNTHDPGITFLEVICYVLSDLDYRIAMPVEDLVAYEKNNAEEMHKQFISAMHVLPNQPVTADDYRKVFVRLEGVRNVWLSKSEHQIVANYKDGSAEPLLHYKKPGEVINTSEELEFQLKGLYNILVDFEEFPELAGNEGLIEAKQQEIISNIRKTYYYFRNLCEDLDEIGAVPEQEIVLCADIQLDAKTDPEDCWAEIIFRLEQYLNPDIPFYSLKQLLDKGLRPDEIFEGPVFDFEKLEGLDCGNALVKKGFISNDDLQNAGLRTEIRLSDLYRIIMETPGVVLVNKLSFGFCPCNEAKNKASEIGKSNQWLLCVQENHKPVLCTNGSVINFHKDIIPVELKTTEANDKLNVLRLKHKQAVQTPKTEDLPMPEGSYRNVETYATLQNDLPENYGISPAGLPETATTQRKSLALQLKAYLLFFDQVLANYFSQLANAKLLLRASEEPQKTYFSNTVNGIQDIEKIFDEYADWTNELDKLLKTNELDAYALRKNKFLDHLLARFAEQFNEYVFIMYRIYGADYSESMIRNKVDFLNDYENMSSCRGSARDLLNLKTAEQSLVNVSGLEKRLTRLLGFNTYKELSLTEKRYDIFKSDSTHYNWTILKEGSVIFKGTGLYNKEFDAYAELGLATILAASVDAYKVRKNDITGKWIYNLQDAEGNVITANDFEIDEDDIQSTIAELIAWFRDDFKMEGIYVVENILLRPSFTYTGDSAAGERQFMPVCIDVNGEYCKPIDPYSFRIHVIIPGYTIRLRDRAFRKYAENIVRLETPAHILPRICFISEEQMLQFETLYKQWLLAKTSSLRTGTEMDAVINKAFIDLLEKLYTIYEQGYLVDCDDDTEDKNPIVLGRTNLGSLQTGNPTS